MEETRNALRRRVRAHRSALAPQTWLCWSRLIQAKVLELPQYLAATSVALYSPADNEVETRAIMDHAFCRRKKVFYPKLDENEFPVFVRVFSDGDFVAGRYGIAEPKGEVRLADADCESLAVMVPGLMFDRRGYRLGRGGGWYDRSLSWLGKRGFFIGLAYEFQVVDRLPEQSWDQRVHYVITEASVIDCGGAPQSGASR